MIMKLYKTGKEDIPWLNVSLGFRQYAMHENVYLWFLLLKTVVLLTESHK